jgi:hypothetical protein
MAVTVTGYLLSANEERGAVVKWYQTAEAVDLNHPAVYLNSSGKVLKAIATSSAASKATGLMVVPDNFYGETAVASGGWVGVCVAGPVQGFSGLTPGAALYVDKTTAGDVTETAPTSAYQYVVARAIAADTVFVDPGIGSPVSA